jgi:hypothetical protein
VWWIGVNFDESPSTYYNKKKMFEIVCLWLSSIGIVLACLLGINAALQDMVDQRLLNILRMKAIGMVPKQSEVEKKMIRMKF